MRTVLLLALLGAAAPAQAQFTFAAAPTDTSLRTLVVRGTGEATARVDRATLRIMFETEGETVDDALVRHEGEVQRVQALLRERGVPDDQVFLDRAAVGSQGGMGPMGPSPDESFTVSRQLTVHVDDLDAAPRLMAELANDRDDDALAIQRRTVHVTYSVRDPDPLHREALREAVRDARERAELIAEMAGLRLGEVLSVAENGAEMGTMFGAGMMEAMMSGMGDPTNGGGGERRVGSVVVVTFAVEQ